MEIEGGASGGGSMTLVGASEEKIAAAVEAAGRRHSEWEAQFMSVGKQEGELFSAQWKMVREEFGTLMKELATVQCQFEEMKVSSGQAAMRMRMSASGQESKFEEQNNLRLKFEEDIRDELRKLKDDLLNEVKQREAGDERVLAEALSKLDDGAGLMINEVRSRDLPAINKNVNDLRSAIERMPVQIDTLRDSIKAEARSRELGHESLTKTIHGHREALSRDISLTQKGLDVFKQDIPGLWDAIKTETSERNIALGPLHERVQGVERDMEPQKQEVPALRRLCEEIRDHVNPKLEAQQRALDDMTGNFKTTQTKLDKCFAELSMKIESESTARVALVQEMEQSVTPLKTKMRNLETGHAEISLQREILEKSVKEQLATVATTHESELQTLQKQITTQKGEFAQRMDTMNKTHKDLAQKVQAEVSTPTAAAARELMSPQSNKKTDDLARQVRDLQSRVPKEGLVSETIMYPHEDHISFLEESLQDFCERFIAGLQRRKGSLTSRSLMIQRQQFSSDYAYGGEEAKFQEKISAGVTVTAGGSAGGSEEVKSSGNNFEASAASASATAGDASAAWKTEKLPGMTSEKEQQLEKIFSSGRVKLVMNKDKKSDSDEAAKIVLTEHIEFKPVHHGDNPAAHFKQADKAKKIITDVAGVMKTFEKATMIIEGHTATAPDKMDQWAHDLANNRAEKVKAALVDLGIEPARLQSLGLPGNKGSGKVDTVFKISSFSV